MVCRAAFDENKFIYLQRKMQKTQRLSLSSRWLDLNDCIEKKIDVSSEYPRCKYLFRCILNTADDEIASLVARAASISPSTKLYDILDLFTQIDEAIQDVSHKKATKSLKQIRTRPIFPITNKKKHLHDSLRTLDDESWFIADRAHLWESFGGKVPLLAFEVKDLDEMEDLIDNLGLDCRKLSELVQVESAPRGLINEQPMYTRSLRAKSEFVKA